MSCSWVYGCNTGNLEITDFAYLHFIWNAIWNNLGGNSSYCNKKSLYKREFLELWFMLNIQRFVFKRS